MGRYLFFAGKHYYPRGGWYAFQEAFDTIEKAREQADYVYPSGEPRYDWWHIVDSATMTILEECRDTSEGEGE